MGDRLPSCSSSLGPGLVILVLPQRSIESTNPIHALEASHPPPRPNMRSPACDTHNARAYVQGIVTHL